MYVDQSVSEYVTGVSRDVRSRADSGMLFADFTEYRRGAVPIYKGGALLVIGQ